MTGLLKLREPPPRQNFIKCLPNELLTQIAAELYLNEPLYFITKQFKALHALSRVCRRFRHIVLPLLWRKLDFSLASNFYDFSRRVKGDKESKQLSAYVETIRIARPAHLWSTLGQEFGPDKLNIDVKTMQHFSHLVSFQCTRMLCTSTTLDVLSVCPHLNRLDMLWSEKAGWPRMELLPNLRTVRLFLTDSLISGHLPNSLPDNHQNMRPYCAITTFALYVQEQPASGSPFVLVLECLTRLTLPELQVLTLIPVQAKAVFWFIHRHPKIVEASVFTNRFIRLEALLQLIDGSGVWRPVDGHRKEVCSEAIDFVKSTDLSHRPSPVTGDLHIGLSNFSFTRVPVPDAAAGSSARYACTALALVIEDKQGYHGYSAYQSSHYADVLGALIRNSPSIKDLRVTCQLENDHSSIELSPWLRSIGKRISLHHNHVQRLAVHWRNMINDGFQWDGEDFDPDFTRTHSDATGVQYLDDADPPFGNLYSHIGTYTLRSVKKHNFLTKQQVEDLEDGLRRVLQLDEDAELDQDDRNLLMTAWELRHRWFVTALVRYIAKLCTHLEEFDWWLRSDGYDESILWHWKIKRDELGNILSMSDKLTWTGCDAGSPLPLIALVGKELQQLSNVWESGRGVLQFNS